MPTKFQAALVVSAGVASLIGCSNPSGVYVHIATDKAELFQLVRSQDGQLSGRYELVGYDSSGHVNQQTADFDGSLDGSQLILKTKPLFGIIHSMTGTLSGDRLAVFVAGQEENFHRASASAFDQEAGKLQVRAAELIGKNQAAKAFSEERLVRSEIGQLRAAMPEFQRELNAQKARYAGLDQTRMAHLAAANRLSQARQPSANDESSAAGDANLEMGQVRLEFGALNSKASAAYEMAGNQIEELKKTCAAPAGKPADELAEVCRQVQQDRNYINILAVQLRQLFGQTAAALQPRV
jgi:hypothetical protein